jgi:hypothetical protein
MRTQAPFLPVRGEEEQKILDLPVHTSCPNLDFDGMALKRCPYVDGINIFPSCPCTYALAPRLGCGPARARGLEDSGLGRGRARADQCGELTGTAPYPDRRPGSGSCSGYRSCGSFGT